MKRKQLKQLSDVVKAVTMTLVVGGLLALMTPAQAVRAPVMNSGDIAAA